MTSGFRKTTTKWNDENQGQHRAAIVNSELGFDPTLIEQNLSLSFSDRIKQASQAANALLKLQAAARNRRG